MIIYGSRMYGTKDVVYTHGTCEHCGNYGRQKSYTASKWGHIYFIPLIPAGGKMRVMKECQSCNMGSHVAAAKVPALRSSITRNIEPAIEAAGRGLENFEDSETGEEIDIASFLSDAMEMLYVLGYRRDASPILDALEASGASYQWSVVSATYSELNGRREEALQHLIRAAEANPSSLYPPYALGQLYLRMGNAEAGLKELQIANQIAGDDVGILLEMTGALETLKRYDELCDVLEKCMDMAPELEKDKPFMKYYKKYSKKALKMSR